MNRSIMACLLETNRLVRELMGGALKPETIQRIKNFSNVENTMMMKPVVSRGRSYSPRRMLRTGETMNAGVERGNEALMRRNKISYRNLDEPGPINYALRTSGILPKHASALRDKTAVGNFPEMLDARRGGGGLVGAVKKAVLDRVLPPNKRGHVFHSPSSVSKALLS